MSWSVSTWVCAGTLSRSTPDPSNGVAPTTSTGGRVKGVSASVEAVSCAAATADSTSNAKAAPGKTCLRSTIFPPVYVPRRRPLGPRAWLSAFPIYLANFPSRTGKLPSRTRYPGMLRRGILCRLEIKWGTGVPMSLRFRLIGLVCLALVVSLALGGATAWVNASRSVRTEMRSALLVGRQTIESGIERLQQAADPSHGLDDLVASFKGNRHLRVQFVGQAKSVATPVVETPPFGALPSWFVGVLRVAPVID